MCSIIDLNKKINDGNELKFTIQVPKKITEKQQFQDVDLLEINKEKDIAKEMIYLFTSKIFSEQIENQDPVPLSSKILEKNFGKSYLKIVKLLEKKNILLRSESYTPKKISKTFSLSEQYIISSPIVVSLNTLKVIGIYSQVLNKNGNFEVLNDINEAIISNLISLEKKLIFPSDQEIKKHAKNLIAANFKTKSGKILKFKNKKSKEELYSEKNKNVRYVEDAITRFNFFKKNQIKIFNRGSKRCARPTHYLSLIDSWIRDLICIDDGEVNELDFRCLHPNLIMSIYGGDLQYITHQQVCDYLNKNFKKNYSLSEIKKEHLSFFNDSIDNIWKYKIYFFYKKNTPELLKAIIRDKYDANDKNITSKKLFEMETQLMNEVIKQLNAVNIYCIYVYDAVYVKKSDQDIAKQIMNDVAYQLGVYTTVG